MDSSKQGVCSVSYLIVLLIGVMSIGVFELRELQLLPDKPVEQLSSGTRVFPLIGEGFYFFINLIYLVQTASHIIVQSGCMVTDLWVVGASWKRE